MKYAAFALFFLATIADGAPDDTIQWAGDDSSNSSSLYVSVSFSVSGKSFSGVQLKPN